MFQTTTRYRDAVATVTTVIRVLVVFNAVTFILASVSHLGVDIPLGVTVIDEPQIIPATIVEGLAGLFFVVTAYAVFARTDWAWPAAIGSHIFALVGVLIGIAALNFGGGPRTELNDAYHLTMLVLLVVGLALLLSSAGKTALRGDDLEA